jgi:hypothetical protein
LVHFELIFVQSKSSRSNLALLHVDIQFSPKTLLKRWSFLYNCFGTVVKNWMAVAMWDYYWVLYSNSLVCVSVFVPVPCVFC